MLLDTKFFVVYILFKIFIDSLSDTFISLSLSLSFLILFYLSLSFIFVYLSVSFTLTAVSFTLTERHFSNEQPVWNDSLEIPAYNQLPLSFIRSLFVTRRRTVKGFPNELLLLWVNKSPHLTAFSGKWPTEWCPPCTINVADEVILRLLPMMIIITNSEWKSVSQSQVQDDNDGLKEVLKVYIFFKEQFSLNEWAKVSTNYYHPKSG